MPSRDNIHSPVKSALRQTGWNITADPLYLAVTTKVYDGLFQEPIGKLVLQDLPLKLVVVDIESQEIRQWIPTPFEPS